MELPNKPKGLNQLDTLSTYFTKNILCLLFSTCKHTVGLIKLIIISSTYLAKLTYLCGKSNHLAKKKWKLMKHLQISLKLNKKLVHNEAKRFMKLHFKFIWKILRDRPTLSMVGFQLVDLIITELKNHMTCYKFSPLIGWNYSIQTGEQIL